MTVTLTENGTCGVGGWTLVMKIDGKNVYALLRNVVTQLVKQRFKLSIVVGVWRISCSLPNCDFSEVKAIRHLSV